MTVPDLVGSTATLVGDLVQAVGGDCSVTDDPAKVAPLVATDGVAVHVGLFTSLEPATLDAFWLTTSVWVALPSPFSPNSRDKGYRVLARLVDTFDVIGSPTPGQVDLGEHRLPGIKLDIRTRTRCI